MIGNPYGNIYNPQASIDRINNQMAELERMKQQLQQPIPQPTNLTQNFQISPNNHDVIKYASSIEEVQKDLVIGDTPYFSRDMSIVWIKNTKNEIKTYELNEIVPKDEKDLTIEFLQGQIEELKGMMKNESNVAEYDAEYVETNTSKNDESTRTAAKKSKSKVISRFSTSNEE